MPLFNMTSAYIITSIYKNNKLNRIAIRGFCLKTFSKNINFKIVQNYASNVIHGFELHMLHIIFYICYAYVINRLDRS